MSDLVELGERYWALGLPAAARSAFARALAARPDDAGPARRLAELGLALGDLDSARRYATEVVRRAPGAASRVLLGQAHLAAGQSTAARLAFAAALDAPRVTSVERARAHLGLGQAAAAAGDRGGAGANVMAALDALLDAVAPAPAAGGAPAADVDAAALEARVDAEIGLAEDLLAAVVAFGRTADAAAALDAAATRCPAAPLGLYQAALGAAAQSHGERAWPGPGGATLDAAIDAALRAEAARRPASRVVRLRVIERQLRRRYQDAAARGGAIAELEKLAAELTEDPKGSSVERARIWFLLAAAFEDDPASAARAEDAYRKGLALRPGHAVAACSLALLMLDRGDVEGALAEIERALRIDAAFGLAWRNAARMLDSSIGLLGGLFGGAGVGGGGVAGGLGGGLGGVAPTAGAAAVGGVAGRGLVEVVGRLLDAANPGAGAAAGSVAPRLLAATAEVARGDVLAGVYAHGHRVKNVLGIIGSRTRSARKLAGDGELADRLRDLEREVTALYEEWAQYLRSMQDAGPTLEVVAVAPLVADVVAAAIAKSACTIDAQVGSALPDLRGDRLLLREALLNVVSNAAEACATTGGAVTVSVRAVPAGGAPAIEVTIADTGPGIARAELPRIFAPGYTTKETGSGVGLTIAERVVAAHHGRIVIESEEGRGTTVTVILPTDLGGFSTLGTLGPR